MSDRLAVLPQYLLPKQALTRFAGLVASTQGGPLTTRLIAWFVRRYKVNMDEAVDPDIRNYATFNEFFTRALKVDARPLARADLVCPVDGAISQYGPIERDQIFQAKGHRYSTTALVGGDAALAARFEDGAFATIYLSPRDYHRIHMPCAGRLTRMIHVPGNCSQSIRPRPVAYQGCSPATSAWCVCSSRRAGRLCWCWSGPPWSAAWPRCGTGW